MLVSPIAYLFRNLKHYNYYFNVSVKKAAKKLKFSCEVGAVYNNMYEEDIYDISRVEIGDTAWMSTRKMPNVRADKYFTYMCILYVV